MRRIITIGFGLILLLSTIVKGQDEQISRTLKGIHQIEWEAHKDFKRKEPVPLFQGTPMDLVERRGAPSKEIFGYLPYWVYGAYPNLNYGLLTTVAYFGVEIDRQGNITKLHDWPASGLVNLAHSNGVRVVLTVFLFNPDDIQGLISDPNRRQKLIGNLLTQVQNANADGVNIDFEGVPSGNREFLTAFMTELTEAFHSNIPGSFVTIFTPAVDWSNVFDYFSLGQSTDGMVLSGYDYHWRSGPTAGAVAPLTGGTYNVTWTVNDYLNKTLFNTSKIILGVPFYGYDWPTVSNVPGASTSGLGTSIFYSAVPLENLLWDAASQTPWYSYSNSNQWHQVWVDDSLSLAKKFELVNNDDLKGIGIWALSYDGDRPGLQGALADAFGATAAPLKPTEFRVLNVGNGEVQVAGQASSGATGYKIYQSADGTSFDSGTDFPGASTIFTNLPKTSIAYFKMASVNGNGESHPTEVLAVKPSVTPVDILIVNGFDRTSGTVNTFDFIKRFAPAVVKEGYAFDSCANEAVQDGTVQLDHYRTVIWISGEEGTTNESFSNKEQSVIADFLESGGNLFISGSEIGYDLVEKGSTSDKTFYSTYFKAVYVRDKVATHSFVGDTNGIFSSLGSIAFDDGTHGTYNVDFPDGIKPRDAAILILDYPGFDANTFGGAGIQYSGIFGNGTEPGRLVYLAVPFETMYPENSRDQMMAKILEFFTGNPSSVASNFTNETSIPNEFELMQNYPNPFNPTTVIRFKLFNKTPERVVLKIYNVLGQEVVTLADSPKSAGTYSVSWDGKNNVGSPVSGGVYVYRLTVGSKTQIKKMTLLK